MNPTKVSPVVIEGTTDRHLVGQVRIIGSSPTGKRREVLLEDMEPQMVVHLGAQCAKILQEHKLHAIRNLDILMTQSHPNMPVENKLPPRAK